MDNSIQDKPETLDFLDVLRQKIRVRIVILLYENVELSYTELLNMLDIDEGLLNFHLRKIKKFIQITDQRTYMLSNYGKIAHEVLIDIENKTKSYGIEGMDLTLKNESKIQRLIGQRMLAFLLDILLIGLSTGIILEQNIYQNLMDIVLLKISIFDVTLFSHEFIELYSNVVIASFIIMTVLEAYKGQTLGKYVMGLMVIKNNGRRITLMDSAVRNIGKVFFFPLDIILGIAFHRKEGYIRFFGYYTQTKVIKVSKR